jgi:hypothetical protein
MPRHALAPAVLAVALSVALSLTPTASAVPHVYKHDQFPSDFTAALAQMNGMSLATQPGFVSGEAFGQIFRPSPDAYPLQITGFDLILAAAPSNPDLLVNAQIEVYNTTATGPDPQSQPVFVASTGDIWNSAAQDFGLPLQGGIGYTITFDLDDPENHPPLIFSGNLFLVIRFTDPPSETTSSAWPVLECIYLPPYLCGCQGVGTIQDPVTTPFANVMHVVTPLGTCSGNKTWMWAEDADVTGDFVMRLRTDIASEPCVADCADKQCGDDGCGGSCGACSGGLQCFQEQCVSCVPDCNARQCGDNGCGGSCGTCVGDDVCTAGWCEAPCAADCTGRVCGDDGCDGSCGSCSDGDTCSGAGKCVTPCSPSCAPSNACGDDGCGGSCGVCATGDHCDAGRCAADCVPDCADRDCGADGCGGSCGTCGAGTSCDAGACVAACAPSCDGRACGDDGCGGACGSCGADQTCVAGRCEGPCAPDCAGKSCGDDGCGSTCGSCAGGASCDAGRCVAAPVALAIDDISPDFGYAGEATPISITGRGFAAGATALIGGQALTGTTFVSSSVLTGSVPAGLNAGSYTVIVANPDGASATLSDAFEVRPVATPATKDGGCSAGGAPLSLLLLLAGLGLAAALRRRRA